MYESSKIQVVPPLTRIPGQDISAPGVSVIPATRPWKQDTGLLQRENLLRVAAYCRVSTGDESQQTSYTNQRAFYSGLIKSRPGWSFVGIYADEACSGTSRSHRKEFNRMMEDARAGKIDYIMTKSISRFARNTIDTLECVRQLRQLSPPVGIVFEKENIDTLNATGELILTILSALAQDESRSLSDNIRWTFQKNFQAGKPQINLNRMIGYDPGEKGEWIINEAQAKTVRFLFDQFVKGYSANQIAGMANRTGMRTVNGKCWRADSVLDVLRNEKYVGDLEMQKTITRDYLTHKSSMNNGEAPKYYVKNHHVGIIDRFTWEKTQMILRSGKKASNKAARPGGAAPSPFGNLICAAELEADGHKHTCGAPLFRLTYAATAVGYRDARSVGLDRETESEVYTFQYPVWRCTRKRGTRKAAGKPSGEACPSAVIQECALEQSFMETLYALKRDYEAKGEQSYLSLEFRKACTEADKRTRGISRSVQRIALLDRQIQELERNYQEAVLHQAEAMKKDAVERYADLRESLARGEITAEQIERIIQDGISAGTSEIPWASVGNIREDSGAAFYAKQARSLKEQLDLYHQNRTTILLEQDLLSVMKRNYDFFLQCLLRLPEENAAGVKLNVNALDARPREPQKPQADLDSAPPIAQAADYLRFERGMYAAFIQTGQVRGDLVVYETSFGIKLVTVGNSRTLRNFLGFRRCREDGTMEILDETWKVNGKSIIYRRKKKSAHK